MDEAVHSEALGGRLGSGNGWVIAGTLVLAVACLGLGSVLQRGHLTELRESLQLGFTPKVAENLPPEYAFTQVALGSFRGLAVDVLWMRAWDLRLEGRFYEQMQLSDWITKLQPRFVEVWKYHSHNLAYNLSEAVHSPEEKWMWVKSGIRLLQDQGIPMNPEATDLYQQLSWIYFHRVGKYSTETHWYFKHRHALEWHKILGAPPQGPTEDVLRWFQPVADAPEHLADLYARYPDAERDVAALGRLHFDLDRSWVELATQLMELRAEVKEMGTAIPEEQGTLEKNKELLAILDTPAGEALLAYARAKVVRDEYHMEPKTMQELVREFGALDWRHPQAHSLYWAIIGARQAGRWKGTDLYVVVQTDRLVIHSLKGLAYSGRIQFDPRTGYYNATPDPRIFDAFEKASAEAARRQNLEGETPVELSETHRGFMEWATWNSYLYSTRENAQQRYARLQAVYGPQWPGLYTKPLDDFVLDQIVRQRDIIEQAQVIIDGLMYNAFKDGYARGDVQFAKTMLEQARRVHERFKKEQRVNSPDPTRQQKELPPFLNMLSDAFVRYLTLPPTVLPLRLKKRLWESLPAQFLVRVYDRVKPRLFLEAVDAGYDPLKVFPEPPGMKEYREALRKSQEGKPPKPSAP